MIDIGSVGVRIVPNMSGFGASVGAAVAGSGSVLSRAGASASVLLTAPIVGAFATGINSAVSFESAFAEVKKTVNGSEADWAKLRTGVLDLAKVMPFTREELAQTAAAAGRFGIANDDIIRFTELATKLGVATGIAPAQVSEQMTRMMNILQVAPKDWEKFFSSIVNLGNEFPTTETNIISMGQRLSQVAAVANVSGSDVLGMATALSSLGIRAEAGGSAMSRVFFKLSDLTKTGGKDLDKFVKDFGLGTAEGFKALYEQDPVGAVTAFLTSVRKLNDEGANVPPMLKEWNLGEIRVRDTILRTSEGLDTWNRAITTAHDGFEKGTALQVEYDKRLETTAAQWQILKNKASDAAVTFGTALLPILINVFDALEPFVELVAAGAQAFADMDPKMQQTVVTIGLVVAAIGPMLFIGSKLAGMFTNIGLAFMGMGQMMLKHPIILIIFLIALAVYEVYKHWEGFKEFWSNMWDDAKADAQSALDFFSGMWDTLSGGGLTFPTTEWEHKGQKIGFAIAEGWRSVWGDVTTWYEPVGHTMDNIFEGVGEFWSDVDNTFHHWADPVAETWRVMWEDLGFAAVFNGGTIGTFIDVMWEGIKSAWDTGSQFLTDTWNVSWPALSLTAGTSFNWMRDNVFSPIADYWGPRLSDFAATTAEAWGIWWPQISSVVSTAWTGIQNKFIEMMGWFNILMVGIANLWAMFDRAWQNMPIIVHTAIEKIKSEISGAMGKVGDFLALLAKVPGSGLAVGAVGAVVNVAGRADDGGIVPGLRGQPQLILAHGGETIYPTHKAQWQGAMGAVERHVHFHQDGPVYVRNDQDILDLRRAFYEQEQSEARATGQNYRSAS